MSRYLRDFQTTWLHGFALRVSQTHGTKRRIKLTMTVRMRLRSIPLAPSPSASGMLLGAHQRRSRVKPGARCAAVQPAPRTYEQNNEPSKELTGIFSSMIDRLIVPSFKFFHPVAQYWPPYCHDELSNSSFQHILHSAPSKPSPVAPTLDHILYHHTISALSCIFSFSSFDNTLP